MTKKPECEECNKLKKELKNSDIFTFLHSNISNTHLADVILDYINMLEERLRWNLSKIRYKHLKKILRL